MLQSLAIVEVQAFSFVKPRGLQLPKNDFSPFFRCRRSSAAALGSLRSR